MAEPTQIAREAIVEGLAGRLNSALNEAVSLVANPAAVVADNNLAAAPLIPIQATVRAACRVYARKGVGNSPLLDSTMGNLCRPYLDSIGESPTPGALTGEAFDGGQCSGTTYQVSCQTTVFANGLCQPTTNPFSLQVPGPVRGPFTDSVSPPPGGPLCGGAAGTRVYLRTGPSQNITVLAGGSFGARISGLSVTPVTGPNNCGDQPLDYTPPAPRPGLPPYRPTAPVPGTGDEVEVDFEFNPDGSITVQLPGLGVETTIGGGGGDGRPPGDIGQPGSPVDTGEGGADDGEAPPGQVIGALKLNLVDPPPSASEFYANVYRGGAWVYMGTTDGLAVHEDGGFLTDGQLVFPKQENLTRWRVVARVGFNWRVTPYYREA